MNTHVNNNNNNNNNKKNNNNNNNNEKKHIRTPLLERQNPLTELKPYISLQLPIAFSNTTLTNCMISPYFPFAAKVTKNSSHRIPIPCD